MKMYEGWKQDAALMSIGELRLNLRNIHLPRDVNKFLAQMLIEKERRCKNGL